MYTNEDKNRARSLSEKGISLRKISDLTGIPKSTVSDWIKEEVKSYNTEIALFSDKEDFYSNSKGFKHESQDISDSNRTDSGQINFKNEKIMNDQDENNENRTGIIHKKISPELLELKKLEIQLHHERELKKIENEERAISLKEDEISRFNVRRSMNAHKLSQQIQSIARDLLNDGEDYECDPDKVEELLDQINELLKEFIGYCKEYNYYYKNSEPYSFLIWIKDEIEAWMDEDEEFIVEFPEKAIMKIESAARINIYEMFL